MACLDPASSGLNPDTIAACATPPGPSGLAVIRLSGPNTIAVCNSLFQPLSARFAQPACMLPYTCSVGYWHDKPDLSQRQRLDQVVLTCFLAPHSFTGEDVMEISCHGGTAVKQAILDSLFQLDVQPAGPGEFSKRAFLNGKMDLTQAEAVMDLIQAEARLQAQAAFAQMQGAIADRVHAVSGSLYRLMARVELILEFPEHDETQDAILGLMEEIGQVQRALTGFTAGFRQGRLLSEGLNVVIAGRPNAGKSSLLNRLAGSDRAIVTDIPGTTRDTVHEVVDLDGLPVRLTDTAGLRQSDDRIEQMGVLRARTAMDQADLVIWIIAPLAADIQADLIEISQLLDLKVPFLLVAGKDDLTESRELKNLLAQHLPDLPPLAFSAVTGEGLNEIRQAIRALYEQAGIPGHDGVLITNSRHKVLADQAAGYLMQTATAIKSGVSLDAAATLLRCAADSLAAITGDSVGDELVNTIFSRFCVGK